METQPLKKKTKTVPPSMANRYTERVKRAIFGPSKSSGNDMITLETEIINPQSIVDGDTEYDLTSLDRKYYLSFGEKALEETNKCLVTLGFEPVAKGQKVPQEVIDTLNNKFCFDSIINSFQGTRQRKNPDYKSTKEGAFKPTEEYIDITDNKGQPIKGAWEMTNSIRDILYRVDQPEGANPY